MKLSIILPYYETYDLMYKLMKELSIQKTDEVEIIIMDDSNEERLDEFKDIATIIHREERQGVAKARNKGVNLAKGKYIAFIDCDDMITMDYVDTLLKAIDTYDTDVMIFNWYDMTTHEEHRNPSNPAPWKGIYKKEICPKFDEGVEFGEDVPFNRAVFRSGFSITWLDKMIYMYNSNRVGSLFWKQTHGGSNK